MFIALSIPWFAGSGGVPCFEAPHRAPLERVIFLRPSYKHLAALRPVLQLAERQSEFGS